jgi:hypothetical protein
MLSLPAESAASPAAVDAPAELQDFATLPDGTNSRPCKRACLLLLLLPLTASVPAFGSCR